MSNASDFSIRNGKLEKYYGKDSKVVVPDGVTAIGYCAFGHRDDITSVTLPSSIKSIDFDAFVNCKELVDINLPDGLTSIGCSAFAGCCKLSHIEIPDSVTDVGSGAFSGCTKLADKQGFAIFRDILFDYFGNGGSVVIPEGITVICSSAFHGCKSLEKVILPASLKTIELCAFCGCSGLKSVTFQDGLTDIGNGSFSGCSELKSIIVPASVTHIGYHAFENCMGIKDIVLQNDATVIEDEAFAGCSGLADSEGFLVFNDILIGYYGKGGEVVVPDGIKGIGINAFRDCKELTGITIPESVEKINDRAFVGCRNLDRIVFTGNNYNIGAEIIKNYAPFKEVVLPDDMLSSGKPIKTVFIPYVHPSAEELGYILVYQNVKSWQDYLLKSLTLNNVNEVYGTAVSVLSDLNKVSENKAKFIADTAVMYSSSIEPEVLRKLSERLSKLKYNDSDLDRVVGSLNENNGSNETPENTAFSKIEGLADLYDVSCEEYAKAIKFVDTGFRYKGSDERCSKKLVAVLLSEYRKIWDQESTYVSGSWSDVNVLEEIHGKADSQIGDAIVDGIEMDDLISFLKPLVMGRDYRNYLLLFARYASEKDIKWLISAIRQSKRGNAQDRYWAGSAEKSLILSDTKEAILYLEKAELLDEYAKYRGTTAELILAKKLYDFGFDENGKKVYDLGGKSVELSLNNDLSLSLFDITENKIVKSIPKKNSDQDKYEAAAADYSDKRSFVRKAAKSACANLFSDFLYDNRRNAREWEQLYSANPLLRTVSRLVVWVQGENTFTVVDGKLKDVYGNPYGLSGEEVGLAHPMEMDPELVLEWQKYFVSNNLKQPFRQVWEPVINMEKVRDDRYTGIEIPFYRFKGQEKHGITFQAYTEFNHRAYKSEYESIYIYLSGCKFEWELPAGKTIRDIVLEDPLKVTAFSVNNPTRAANHIIVYLDSCTVYGRIEKDDDSVLDNMDGYTVVQIDAFLKYAIEKNSPKCTAAFMNYKHEHYSEFDEVDEFTLDF